MSGFFPWMRVEWLRTECVIARLKADREAASADVGAALTAEIDQLRAMQSDRAAILRAAANQHERNAL